MNEPSIFRVVLNDEGQYSLLPASIANPPGWRNAGKSGSQEECLAFIREQWVDMRPLSVRALLKLPILLTLFAQ